MRIPSTPGVLLLLLLLLRAAGYGHLDISGMCRLRPAPHGMKPVPLRYVNAEASLDFVLDVFFFFVHSNSVV